MRKHVLRLYGPFNTGTNLTEKLLNEIMKKNYNVRIQSKHGLNWEAITHFLKYSKHNRVVLMYRPILSWLKGMKKASYTLNYKSIYSEKLCFYHVGNRYPMKNNVFFKDIFDMYSQYYSNYKKLKEQFGDQVTILNYSKIIDPEINKDNNYLKSKFPNGIFNEHNITRIFNKPSKNHGKSVQNCDKAQSKYQSDINNWTDKDKNYIKSKIDNTLLDFFDNE